jgi:hypothetical protein
MAGLMALAGGQRTLKLSVDQSADKHWLVSDQIRKPNLD